MESKKLNFNECEHVIRIWNTQLKKLLIAYSDDVQLTKLLNMYSSDNEFADEYDSFISTLGIHNKTNNKGITSFYIIDEKKWLMAKLRYGL